LFGRGRAPGGWNSHTGSSARRLCRRAKDFPGDLVLGTRAIERRVSFRPLFWPMACRQEKIPSAQDITNCRIIDSMRAPLWALSWLRLCRRWAGIHGRASRQRNSPHPPPRPNPAPSLNRSRQSSNKIAHQPLRRFLSKALSGTLSALIGAALNSVNLLRILLELEADSLVTHQDISTIDLINQFVELRRGYNLIALFQDLVCSMEQLSPALHFKIRGPHV
jgi:hypothetical protein